jgi:hypothetical protein
VPCGRQTLDQSKRNIRAIVSAAGRAAQHCVTVLAVCALAGLAIGWHRSRDRSDCLYHYSPGRVIVCESSNGCLWIGRNDDRDWPAHMTREGPWPGWHAYSYPHEPAGDSLVSGIIGTMIQREPDLDLWRFGIAGYSPVTYRYGGTCSGFVVGYRVLVAADGVLLAALWIRPVVTRIRTARRTWRSLCPNCGYDVRATPGRCPECGWCVRSTG